MKDAITVSQLNSYIKELVSTDLVLRNVLVKGEVSNLKESKGNYYFSLKDEYASVQCIVFTRFSGISVDISNLTDGQEYLIEGRVAIYEKSGTYSIYVSKIVNIGIGEYYLKLEALKKRLAELGMFDETYKKPIPKYSQNIGVVTAKNGAAIKDIYTTIKNKNPYANVFLYPSLVQGEEAYKTIVDGIMALDKMGLDVIIIGRGGGSIEDLYVFNDERVAYAIFNAKTPIISAVGHEINDSVSDLVADLRVATPTAAGEAATFSYSEFENDLMEYKLTLDNNIENILEIYKERLKSLEAQITLLSPKARIDSYRDRLSNKKILLDKGIKAKILYIKSSISNYIEMLKNRDVLSKIESGFSYTTNKNNKRVTSIKDVKKGDCIYSRVVDGVIESKVINSHSL